MALGDIISEVQHQLNLRLLVSVHVVVDIYVRLELYAIANDLIATLSKCLFHVRVRSKSKRTPKRILDATLGYADCVIDPLSST